MARNRRRDKGAYINWLAKNSNSSGEVCYVRFLSFVFVSRESSYARNAGLFAAWTGDIRDNIERDKERTWELLATVDTPTPGSHRTYRSSRSAVSIISIPFSVRAFSHELGPLFAFFMQYVDRKLLASAVHQSIGQASSLQNRVRIYEKIRKKIRTLISTS